MARLDQDDILAVVRRLTSARVTPMFAYTASEFHGGLNTYVRLMMHRSHTHNQMRHTNTHTHTHTCTPSFYVVVPPFDK